MAVKGHSGALANLMASIDVRCEPLRELLLGGRGVIIFPKYNNTNFAKIAKLHN